MRGARVVSIACLGACLAACLAACGGQQIPQHNGYKSEHAQPWKKPRVLKLDDKNEAKADGDLSYADRRRAIWFAADLPSHGELDLRVENTGPGDAVNDSFDLGFEVLDPANRFVSRNDLDNGGEGQPIKEAKLLDLAPGRYLIHLFLQGRLDTADYTLKLAFHASAAAEIKSDFPAQVAFLQPLPMVPLNDDTPKSYHPPTQVVVVHAPHHHEAAKPPPPPAPTTLSARIIGMSVVSGGTQITVGRGTSSGAAAGMKGTVQNLSHASFQLSACGDRTCTATVQGVTPDQIKQSGAVTLTP